MVVNLFQPKLRACPGKTLAHPPATTHPGVDLRGVLPPGWSLVSFDGFIVNDHTAKDLLVLREYVGTDPVAAMTAMDWVALYQASYPAEYADQVHFANSHGLPLHLVFTPKDYPETESHGALIAFIENASTGNPILRPFDKDSFPARIRGLRGYGFRNPKNLKAAKTRLECYLANETQDPWPGDVDDILLKDGRPVAILEYKTHNLPTPIQNESIGKYGPEDWRRFSALYALQDRLQGVPILFVVWGPEHASIKIDKITTANRVAGTQLCPRQAANLLQTLLGMLP